MSADGGRGHSIGVDIGGTFTDCVVLTADGRHAIGKVPTTPGDLSVGFFGAVADAGAACGLELDELLAATGRLAHGTTAGINALVTRAGAEVGLLATAGHGDALRIMDNSGRVTGASLEELLDYSISGLPERFVTPRRTLEVTERLDYAGAVVTPLDEDDVRRAVRELVDQGVEAIAVALLWSHVNPDHERRVRAIVEAEAPDVFVTCSHEVAPRMGEYPRTATTVMNAYIGPLMGRYLDTLVARARDLGYEREMLFATCEGGLTDLETVKRYPLLTAQSGPVGGALACAAAGKAMGFDNVIATDMGGTSLDASLVEQGDVQLTDETVIERHQVYLRKVAVESIGTGGGSIAWYDEGKGTLRVGPRSAGAQPGPVCYGRGGVEPTVTDADLVLGLLSEDAPLASGLRLDRGAAEQALARLGERVGLDAVRTAAGIVQIADSQMEDLLRRMTLQQGRDPREFSVWAFGGAAGLHGALYSTGLGVREVVVPLAGLASVWSAYGVASAEISRTFQRPLHLPTPLDRAAVRGAFAALEDQAEDYRRAVGLDPARVRLRRTVEMKYAMQWYSVEVDLGFDPLDDGAVDAVVERFERTYERRYGPGSGYREGGMVLTAARVQLSSPSELGRPREHRGGDAGEPAVPRTSRPVFWLERDAYVETPVYAGETLATGATLAGPAVVEYPETTVAVRPGQALRLDAYGNLVMTPEAAATGAAAPQLAEGRA